MIASLNETLETADQPLTPSPSPPACVQPSVRLTSSDRLSCAVVVVTMTAIANQVSFHPSSLIRTPRSGWLWPHSGLGAAFQGGTGESIPILSVFFSGSFLVRFWFVSVVLSGSFSLSHCNDAMGCRLSVRATATCTPTDSEQELARVSSSRYAHALVLVARCYVSAVVSVETLQPICDYQPSHPHEAHYLKPPRASPHSTLRLWTASVVGQLAHSWPRDREVLFPSAVTTRRASAPVLLG